jgi:hypothetical protein
VVHESRGFAFDEAPEVPHHVVKAGLAVLGLPLRLLLEPVLAHNEVRVVRRVVRGGAPVDREDGQFRAEHFRRDVRVRRDAGQIPSAGIRFGERPDDVAVGHRLLLKPDDAPGGRWRGTFGDGPLEKPLEPNVGGRGLTIDNDTEEVDLFR